MCFKIIHGPACSDLVPSKEADSCFFFFFFCFKEYHLSQSKEIALALGSRARALYRKAVCLCCSMKDYF